MAALAGWLPTYQAWSARFFEHSAHVADGGTEGPWQATAYPRATTPTQAAPDAAGRLSYTQLVEEQWAHNYRYAILPYGRYDLLWQKLWESPVFKASAASTALMQLRTPARPQEGGLDVVIDRIRPIEPPLILRSGRLDRGARLGRPAAPGATWEVILARHTEQAMVDRNQSLARRVGFRQVSFTLLRRFAYPGWPANLKELVALGDPTAAVDLDVRYGRAYDPGGGIGLPGEYPLSPDHLDLAQPLSEADRLSLDLPKRLGAFGQGALALQWQGLPFFYEHKLLVTAQSATTVSAVNEVTQRDFDYVSPSPAAGAALAGSAGLVRTFVLPLSSFWESMTDEARRQWPGEGPPDCSDGAHKIGLLPDPEVVYQLILNVRGNVEVQVEYGFEEQAAAAGGTVPGAPKRCLVTRQLGKSLLGRSARISPPAAPGGRFLLQGQLEFVSAAAAQGTVELRTRRGGAAPSTPVVIEKGA